MAHDPNESLRTEPRVFFSRNAELIFASNVVPSSDPSLAGIDGEWRKRQREELGPKGQPYLELVESGIDWAMLSLCDYLPISGLYDDWEAFSAFVKASPIDDFLYVILNNDIPLDEIPRLRADPGRVTDRVNNFTCFSRMNDEAAVRVFSDPEDFRNQLLAYVEANRTAAFEEKLAELMPRYEARMKSARERLKEKDPVAFTEEVSKKPFIRSRVFQTYSFVPSYFIGSKSVHCYGENNFMLAISLNNDAETNERSKELSDRMKVLGDRTRLDILRLLGEGPSYGKAIADRLELTTATVSRQLDQLKTEGLIVEDRADATNIKLVHLKTEAVDELFRQVQDFLLNRT